MTKHEHQTERIILPVEYSKNERSASISSELVFRYDQILQTSIMTPSITTRLAETYWSLLYNVLLPEGGGGEGGTPNEHESLGCWSSRLGV